MLAPRPRAVLILRDVLGYRAAEVASLLDATEASVTSTLKRARATVARRAESTKHRGAPPAGSPVERALVAELTRAYADGDLDALISLLTDDVWFAMPPLPFEYQGRGLARQFNAAVTFRQGRTYDLMPTRANGQPAFGAYRHEPVDVTRFDNDVLGPFGLPLDLPA